jgi:hypothetical protein
VTAARNPAATAMPQLDRMGFAVWAFALAVGVLIHEWQRAKPPWSLTGITVVLAVGVLLKPRSVPRLVALLAAIAVELVVEIPDVFNHTIIIGIVSLAVVAWWFATFLRSSLDAVDPALVFRSVTPFLRLGFVLVLFATAISKLNTGFLDPATTCAVQILDSIPLVTVPSLLATPAIAMGILVEFLIPTLLVFRRTRLLGVIVGISFELVTAAAGHAPFAAFGWSFYLLFIPPMTLGRVLLTVRRWTPSTVRGVLTRYADSVAAWIALATAALVVMLLVQLIPANLAVYARTQGASLAFCTYLFVWSLLLVGHWRHWLRRSPSREIRFGVGSPIFAIALAAFLLNAASPYVGLKTTASFTMFSNLQTEPGRWNHIVLPEAFRIFGLQDGLVRFDEISDPAMAARVRTYSGEDRWVVGPKGTVNASVVLLAAQRIAADYPNATVRYEYDGQARVAAPVSADPILGAGVDLLTRKLGGFRPVDSIDVCQF